MNTERNTIKRIFRPYLLNPENKLNANAVATIHTVTKQDICPLTVIKRFTKKLPPSLPYLVKNFMLCLSNGLIRELEYVFTRPTELLFKLVEIGSPVA